ncbi:hypothetical protein N0V82_010685 [Gnomoniopsis sp. IMI 355080]|nr:hypothetical protein N0V82_010685 [Gnomoniopsis sp. IMI 355080]
MESAVPFASPAAHQHSSLPASPTLTNPDMILPDYERSPSPIGYSDAMQSTWSSTQPGQAPHQYNAYPVGNNAIPITPIIYGNGTMLSDIGEVTEAESTPGKPSPPRHRYTVNASAVPAPGLKVVEDSEGDAALRSSPTIGKTSVVDKTSALSSIKKRAKAEQRERRSSSDSNSTITDHDHIQNPPVFADFDDTVSVGESVFQGDDEESLASSYVDDSSLADGPPALSSGMNPRDSGQRYSTAQLSKRAEQILANAKKRLTSFAAASGHHRTGSDNALRIGIPVKVYPQRSSSVLGISPGPRHPGLTVSRSADQLNGQFNRQRASYIMRDASLEPLGEDVVSPSYRRSELNPKCRYSSLTSPTFGSAAEKGLSRSASTSQMRDIKDHVNDLKGKISSLRQQARADSLKRSSLQSLRTPSPFTHSKIGQWYTSAAGNSDRAPEIKNMAIPSWSGESADEDSFWDGDLGAQDQATPDEGSPGDIVGTDVHGLDVQDDELEQFSPDPFEYDIVRGVRDDSDDMHTENGDAEEDGVMVEEPEFEDGESVDNGDDAVSDSGDSIYHESVQHVLSHEDREDAFDYEHFFLHSAMGTISQRLARRESDASFTSEDSVETTRGPIVESEDTDQEKPPSMTRRGSETSISTMDSFATAEEALSSRQGSLDLNREEVEAPLGTEQAVEDEDDEAADEVEPEAFPVLPASSTAFERPETPPTAKRATFAGVGSPLYTATSPAPGGTRLGSLYSAIRRPMSSTAMTRSHASSTSSFESTGTTRSFPLVNRPTSKASGSSGIFTPDGRSSDSDGKTASILFSSRASQNSSAINGETNHSISLHSTTSSTSLMEKNGTTAVLETLPRDDQFLVERLVASLGRCVLGLTENSKTSMEARMYRRRIDAARKILEGFDKV